MRGIESGRNNTKRQNDKGATINRVEKKGKENGAKRKRSKEKQKRRRGK